ncbi:cupin domain-containing protein [Lacticaseibacillus jixiensis]|uniref:cupin domain-containing protein n=1 Tax=Lacticaseibacillus jixiensis TaxID=3231926 RepID=UPI0036F39502
MFFHQSNLPITQIDANSTRQVLAHGDGLMNALITFQHALPETATIPLHQHPHVQTTYVLKGAFKFEIDYPDHQAIQVVHQGDAIYFPANHPHGCIPLEDDSKLLDSFTPIREDFL